MSSSLLWTDLLVGSCDLESGLRVTATLAGSVTFEDNGTVEDIFAKWEVEVVCWVGGEAQWLHGWEVVDGGEDIWG